MGTEGSTYEANAYSEEHMRALVKAAGFRSFKSMIAELSAEGLTVAEMAERVGASAHPFSAYHSRWIRKNTEPLRLGDSDDIEC